MPTRLMPYNNTMQNAITFEMNLSKKMYFRRVYSTLDFLSDIGGLYGATMPIILTMLMAFNYYASYQFIMHELFVDSVGKKDDEVDSDGNKDSTLKIAGTFKRFTHKKNVTNNVQWNVFKTMCLNLRTFVSARYRRLCCAQKISKRTKMHIKGYKHVLQEISIVNILKQLRVLKAIAKQGKSEH